MKVRTNRQIGWFIEVTATHSDKVPEEWTRKQQMTNGSRYVTDELREQDDLLLTAESKSKSIEYALFCSLRDRVRQHANKLAQIASKVAAIDVLQCFASTARQRSWVKPVLGEGRKMMLSQARHPVLEVQQGFVPNDVVMDDKRRFLLITGPNMGGKSTYLRTVALVSILAQAGSFVPAEKARLGLIDRIFTRVGASDDLRRGRSTFMMEMIEVAHILRRASSKSLLLLDEIGRGTSTFDGLSIAWAVTEDVCNRIGARSLFATHYHNWLDLNRRSTGLQTFTFKSHRAMAPSDSCTPWPMVHATNRTGSKLQHSLDCLVTWSNEPRISSPSWNNRLRVQKQARWCTKHVNRVSHRSLVTLQLLQCRRMSQRLHR